MATVLMTLEEKTVLRINPKSAQGNPADIDTQDQLPVWTNDTGLDLQPATDGKSCTVRAGTAAPGTHTVSFTKADADRDAGEVRELPTEQATIILVLPEAETAGLTADAPTPANEA